MYNIESNSKYISNNTRIHLVNIYRSKYAHNRFQSEPVVARKPVRDVSGRQSVVCRHAKEGDIFRR